MINDKNYKDYLKGLNIVFVESDSCPSCTGIKFILSKVCNDISLNLLSIEANENSVEFLKKYDINFLPSILIFKDELILGKTKGYQPEEILKIWIEAIIGKE